MEKITFLIQGSDPNPYAVVFNYNNTSLTISCSCAAGISGQLCKHRTSLFGGDITTMVSSNKQELATVLEWFNNSKIPGELTTLSLLEKQLEEVKKNIINKKKQIARMCSGN